MSDITFIDPETGNQITGESSGTFFAESQKYAEVTVHGIDWLVPVGWPNNASPICRESEPEAYEEVYSFKEV